MFKFGRPQGSPFDALFEAEGSATNGDQVDLVLRDGGTSDLDSLSDGRVSEEFLSSDTGTPWQNPANRFDTNNSGDVTASDAMVIINRLRADGESVLPAVNNEVNRFYDVNGDGRVTALDALQIINELARSRNEASSGEESRAARTDQVIASMAQDDDDADGTKTNNSRCQGHKCSNSVWQQPKRSRNRPAARILAPSGEPSYFRFGRSVAILC